MAWKRLLRFPAMRALRHTLVLAFVLLSTSTVTAADYSGLELFIPVVSRVPGANATQWRTDLVIANRGEFDDTTVKLIYDPAGNGSPQQSSVTIPAHGSVTIPDVLLATFGRQQSYGTLWLGTLHEEAPIVAHARIYNTGNSAGEFGQLVQAMPIEQLSKNAWINGVIGIRGNRTNLGIANPNNGVAKYTLQFYDKSGNLQGTVSNQTIQPWDVILLNDIFLQLHSAPDEGVTIHLIADVPIYAYASVVRNDTGDAYTIMGDGRDE
jgi:hypothetical protein